MHIGLFHSTSEYIHRWVGAQPHVKEESLTDWLLYNISLNDKRIFYKAFTRNEEAQNGADWEWWVVVNHPHDVIRGNPVPYAFRFLVQAKKLKFKVDNYPLLAYTNRRGVQMDLLLNESKYRGAFPLYMFYSTSKPNYKTRRKYKHQISVRHCRNCINGGFLAQAEIMKKMSFGSPRHNIIDTDILGQSVPLSVIDILFNTDSHTVYKKLWELNRFYLDSSVDGSVLYPGGFMHTGTRIPDYLWSFISASKEGANDWFESEMSKNYGLIGGLGVIDLRSQ